ncbi:MAG: ATP/GTP-binding protein [Flexilinea sp.]
MLLQFSFKNYLSFRDEAILDLTATKITEYSNRIFTTGYEKVLPVAIIYGANASGKSNVYEAFRYMHYYVQESFSFGGDTDSGPRSVYRKRTPFCLDKNSKDKESSFEVYFTDPTDNSGKSFNYGFCLDAHGVSEEWLNKKSKTSREYSRIFYRRRDENILDLCGLPAKTKSNIEIALEDEVLIVSLGAKLKIDKLKAVRDWFQMNEFTNFGDPVEDFFLHQKLPRGFVEDAVVQENVAKFISTFDKQIKGFHIEEVPGAKDDEKKYYHVDTIHKKADSDNEATIPLQNESAGTLKMFALYPDMHAVLEKGSVLFVDELNARLHPLLVRNILLAFLDPQINSKKAQLIFTTHDTWQLANDSLRRDEIWFTEKDEDGASSLYSLAEYYAEDGSKIRKDESYEKNYLLGKYGAIPNLSSMNVIMEE